MTAISDGDVQRFFQQRYTARFSLGTIKNQDVIQRVQPMLEVLYNIAHNVASLFVGSSSNIQLV
jgi:hypothetical protein